MCVCVCKRARFSSPYIHTHTHTGKGSIFVLINVREHKNQAGICQRGVSDSGRLRIREDFRNRTLNRVDNQVHILRKRFQAM